MLEQLGAILLIAAPEVALKRAVASDAASRRQDARPNRERLVDCLNDLACVGIIDGELAGVRLTLGREHRQRRANVRLARRVRDLEGLIVHADVVGGDVEEARERRVGSRLLILEAQSGGADVLGVDVSAVQERGLRSDNRRTAVVLAALVEVNAGRPVQSRVVGLRNERLAGEAIDRVSEAVTVEVDENLAVSSPLTFMSTRIDSLTPS